MSEPPWNLEAFRVRGFGVTPGAQSSHYPPRSSVPPQVAGDHDIDCAAPPSLSIRTLLRREPSHFGPMKSLPLTLLLWARGELSVLSPRLGDRVVRVADLRTATIRPSLLPLPRLPFPWLPFPSQRPNVFLVQKTRFFVIRRCDKNVILVEETARKLHQFWCTRL